MFLEDLKAVSCDIDTGQGIIWIRNHSLNNWKKKWFLVLRFTACRSGASILPESQTLGVSPATMFQQHRWLWCVLSFRHHQASFTTTCITLFQKVMEQSSTDRKGCPYQVRDWDLWECFVFVCKALLPWANGLYPTAMPSGDSVVAKLWPYSVLGTQNSRHFQPPIAWPPESRQGHGTQVRAFGSASIPGFTFSGGGEQLCSLHCGNGADVTWGTLVIPWPCGKSPSVERISPGQWETQEDLTASCGTLTVIMKPAPPWIFQLHNRLNWYYFPLWLNACWLLH